MVELDFVYRSQCSGMAPAVDVGFLTHDLVVIAFQNGLIEIVDLETRELVDQCLLEDKSITGICVLDSEHIIVQTKGDSITFLRIKNWKTLWSISTKKSASFSRPVVIGRTVCFVVSGQHELGFVNIDTGCLEQTLLLPDNPGLVTCMEKKDEKLIVLTESGNIFTIADEDNKVKIQKTERIKFPDQSAVPTCLTGSVVGFSDGSILKDGEFVKVSDRGIGDMTRTADNFLLIGGWNGVVCPSDGHQPHIASIRAIACSGKRAAFASTDGRVSIWYLDDFSFD
jgi:hypothetical protein